ncbi:MAG: hypothetical protein RID93_45735 [Sandaracinaceae bacterium]
MSTSTLALTSLLLLLPACEGPAMAVPPGDGGRSDAGSRDAAPSDAASDVAFDAGARADGQVADGGRCEGVAARLVWSEDFEGEPDLTLSSAEVIDDASCNQGARCARVNLMAGKDDPLIAAEGTGRATVEVSGLPLDGPEALGLIISHDFRFDDAHWQGDTFDNPDPDSIRVNLKGGYYGMKVDGVPWTETSFYVAFHGGEDGAVNLGDNGGDRPGIPWAGWTERAYGWRNGGGSPTALSYMSTGVPFGADGRWHRFELEVRFMAGGDHHLAQIRVDGAPATGGNAPDGWFALPPEYRVTRYSTSYSSSSNPTRAEDRVGVACGMQFDDMRVARLEACAP